jgi:hypothetical protein
MPQRYANAGDYEAARFLKMLALGISRYHPDPGRGYRGCAEVMKRIHVPSMEPSASNAPVLANVAVYPGLLGHDLNSSSLSKFYGRKREKVVT